jgi:hypothetical protein
MKQLENGAYYWVAEDGDCPYYEPAQYIADPEGGKFWFCGSDRPCAVERVYGIGFKLFPPPVAEPRNEFEKNEPDKAPGSKYTQE